MVDVFHKNALKAKEDKELDVFHKNALKVK